MTRPAVTPRGRAPRPSGLRYAQLARPALANSRARVALALTALIGGTLVMAIGLVVALLATGLGEWLFPAGSDQQDSTDIGPITPIELGLSVLLVPVFTLPPAILTARWVLGMSVGEVCSVTGRFRWRWYVRSLLFSILIVVLISALPFLLPGNGAGFGAEAPGGGGSTDWPLLLMIILLCVPVQAFAEEFVFRGVLLQIIGAGWVRGLAAFGVPAVITSVAFALVHAPPAWAPLLAYTVGGICYALLCDRSGGLEASSAAHAAWNIALFASAALITPAATEGGGTGGGIGSASGLAAPEVLLSTFAADVLLAAGLILLAHVSGLAARTRTRTESTPEPEVSRTEG